MVLENLLKICMQILHVFFKILACIRLPNFKPKVILKEAHSSTQAQ